MDFYFLPFAGGSEISYNPLVDILSSKGFNSYQCSLPGRGRRFNETLLETVPEMAQDIFSQIKDKLSGKDYVLFGHSMGALLTIHVLSLLERQNHQMPKHVFISGRGGKIKMPTLPYMSQMDSTTFRAMLSDLGGIPEEVLKEDSIMSFFEPIIKADFKSIENYKPIDINLPELPVTVYYGEEEGFNIEEVKCWQRISNQKISYKAFNGGHFFVLDECKEVVEDILFQIS